MANISEVLEAHNLLRPHVIYLRMCMKRMRFTHDEETWAIEELLMVFKRVNNENHLPTHDDMMKMTWRVPKPSLSSSSSCFTLWQTRSDYLGKFLHSLVTAMYYVVNGEKDSEKEDTETPDHEIALAEARAGKRRAVIEKEEKATLPGSRLSVSSDDELSYTVNLPKASATSWIYSPRPNPNPQKPKAPDSVSVEILPFPIEGPLNNPIITIHFPGMDAKKYVVAHCLHDDRQKSFSMNREYAIEEKAVTQNDWDTLDVALGEIEEMELNEAIAASRAESAAVLRLGEIEEMELDEAIAASRAESAAVLRLGEPSGQSRRCRWIIPSVEDMWKEKRVMMEDNEVLRRLNYEFTVEKKKTILDSDEGVLKWRGPSGSRWYGTSSVRPDRKTIPPKDARVTSNGNTYPIRTHEPIDSSQSSQTNQTQRQSTPMTSSSSRAVSPVVASKPKKQFASPASVYVRGFPPEQVNYETVTASMSELQAHHDSLTEAEQQGPQPCTVYPFTVRTFEHVFGNPFSLL